MHLFCSTFTDTAQQNEANLNKIKQSVKLENNQTNKCKKLNYN